MQMWEPPSKPKVLISFAYYHNTNIDRMAGGLNHPFFIADSGAFSAMTRGLNITVEHYARWLKRWKHNFDFYFNLDVIRDWKASERNLRRLQEHGLDPVPVFHTGSPWEVFEGICAEHSLVSLGGMAGKHMGMDTLLRWLVHCFKIARDHGTKIHGLGMTTPKLNASLPFYSIDSTSWVAGSMYGCLLVFDGRGKLKQAMMSNPQSVKKIAPLIREHGLDPEKFYNRDRYHWTDAVTLGARSYWKYEEWLRSRHGAVEIEGKPSGLNLCLVAGSPQIIGHAFMDNYEEAKAWSKTLKNEEAYL
jgi:hypothetical protein